jgi:cytochrome c-type biogenesis protein CcmH
MWAKPSVAVLAMVMLATCASAESQPAPSPAAAPTVKEVGEALVCLCGCNSVLNQCPHQTCGFHDEINAVIAKEIAAGKDKPTIVAGLVERYGIQVLAAPPAEGFNLVAWILPGIALVAGLAIVALAVRRMRRLAASKEPAAALPVDPKVLAAVEEEMKKVTQ